MNSDYSGPTRYCMYDDSLGLVEKARELVGGTAYATIAKVYEYVTRNVAYDYEKARRLKGGRGYVPDPESTYEEGSGVCFDLASLMCAMLRSQGVPAKLCVGDIDGKSHAWVHAWDGSKWLRCDPTIAQSGGRMPTKGHQYVTKYEL